MIVNDTYDVQFSPDDGGWYVQRFPDHACSIVYSTKGAALRAIRDEAITWDDDAKARGES